MSAVTTIQQPGMRGTAALLRPLIPFASLVVGAVAWQVAGVLLHVQWLPPIGDVLGRIGVLWQTNQLQPPLEESIGNLIIGYAISVVAGVTIGTLMALNRKINYALRLYVDALISAPSIVIAPIFFIFFGLSRITTIAVVILYAVVFIIVNTYTAISEVDSSLKEMARSLGGNPLQVFFAVTLRSAGPLLMTGLRLGAGRAVKGMINGELIITVVGLGALDEKFEGAFDAPGILAIALVVILVAIVATTLLDILDRLLNSWVR